MKPTCDHSSLSLHAMTRRHGLMRQGGASARRDGKAQEAYQQRARVRLDVL